MLLVFAAGSVLFVRDDYVIRDDPSFVNAMGIWAPVITADRDLAAPREVKRFVNKARYFAMRLWPQAERRSWLRRLLQPKPTENSRTKISEANIVALTALHHLHPERFALPQGTATFPMKDLITGGLGRAAAAVFDRHRNEFQPWPDAEQLGLFLAWSANTPLTPRVVLTPDRARPNPLKSPRPPHRLRAQGASSATGSQCGRRQ
jgi:hypothetical protein